MLRRMLRMMHRPVYAARVRALSGRIVRVLRPGDRVLDVGCGEGAIAEALLKHPACPRAVTVEGLENRPRGGEPLRVHAYGGGRFPFRDGSFEVVVIADVIHHDPRPDELFAECVRVARRAVVVKDHLLGGVLARPRVMLLDWAANTAYGVKCLFQYKTQAEWRDLFRRHGLRPIVEERSIRDLYPPGCNAIFGGGIQYFAVLEADGERLVEGGADAGPPVEVVVRPSAKIAPPTRPIGANSPRP